MTNKPPKLKSLESLDAVLKRYYDNQQEMTKINIDNFFITKSISFPTDTQVIIDKLVKDELLSEDGVVHKIYKISFEGIFKHEKGGYSQELNDENAEREYKLKFDTRMERNATLLNRGTWALVFVTGLLLIVGIADLWYRLHCH